jgi:hypothetical protein
MRTPTKSELLSEKIRVAPERNCWSLQRVKRLLFFIQGLLAVTGTGVRAAEPTGPGQIAPPRFAVSLPAQLASGTTAGRIFLFIAPNAQNEPRFSSSASLFGFDAHGVTGGQTLPIDPATPGFPEASLGELAPGDYIVQAVFNVLTEFHRADGHVIWAHMDQWEGQNFARSPGNLFSEPQKIRIGADAPPEVVIRLEKTIPPIEVPADTDWVKRIKFQSPLLTRFWGRPMYLGATVLLPEGYGSHPGVRYPVVYIQNHFSLSPPFGFNPVPAADGKGSWARQCAEARSRNLPPPELPDGVTATGAYSNAETGAEFAQAWRAADFPRMILVTFQHPTPYFDDSYGINSPNCGPYGDAILQELIPELESRFRTIKSGYARVLTGSSTGGWGSLALQLYYPDFFGGAWAFSPDPVDFRLYYGGVDLYRDENAFVEKSAPGLAGGAAMCRRSSQRAAILGTQEGRFEWWKHTPAGPDGYPLPVWDLKTGKIDRAVVEAMRANNYDLREFLSRQWPQLGPKLVGKLHVCASAVDSFYSNFAVRLLDEFMQGTTNPHDSGSFTYGPPSSRHGWQPTTNAGLLQAIAAHISKQSPPPESLTWHY